MNIKHSYLELAVQENIIDKDQMERLWQFLSHKEAENPGFHLVHVFYYLGGMVAISAMSLFMTLGWEAFGGFAILGLSLSYALLALGLTEYFLKRKMLIIPAGIMATLVVALTPLAVYGLQDVLGFWANESHYRDFHRYIDWRWILMELSTLVVGVIMLWRYRFPFLMMPVAVILWYMSMDLTPFLFHDTDDSWVMRKWVSLLFGLIIVTVAVWVDIRSRHSKDFAFWLYIFGVMTFWGGMSSMDSGSELGKFIYLCINIAMIFFGAIISRRVFAIFGGFGCAGYLGYLAYRVFEDSLLFPLFLSFIGLGIIYIGIKWQKHEQEISVKMRSILPLPLRELIENRR